MRRKNELSTERETGKLPQEVSRTTHLSQLSMSEWTVWLEVRNGQAAGGKTRAWRVTMGERSRWVARQLLIITANLVSVESHEENGFGGIERPRARIGCREMRGGEVFERRNFES